MNFVDNNGCIFELDSYSIEPVGYEYNNNPYIFWIDSVNDNKLSVNNFYIKTINLLLPAADDIKIEVKIDSHIFYLLRSNEIHDVINNIKSISDIISIDASKNTTKYLSSENDNDLIAYKINNNGEDYLLMPLYVITNSQLAGTWTTNILITVEYDSKKEWCPITVGGVFSEFSEELIINGKNMGINLPEEIIKAIYQEPFHTDILNEQIYNEKLKEYLLNYMGIKGEIGNFNSVEKSLAWFGYGDKIKLSKLYQTDNEFKNQFIKDYFNINNDILETYKLFRNSTYISLDILKNTDTEEINSINFNDDLFGEGHPKLKSLFDELLIAKNNTSSNEIYQYVKSYYDYSFNELGLKLACLKYYFEKYFLPIHLSIHSAAINEKVYMNDLKILSNINTQITENTMLLGDELNEVEFYPNKDIYFTHKLHYVDNNMNEFTNYNFKYEDIYYINDTCANIPIKFKSNDKLYDCVLLLSKNTKDINDNPYTISINHILQISSELELYDKNNNLIDLSEIYFSYSIDKKQYSKYYKGYDKLINLLKTSNKKIYSTEYTGNDLHIDGKISAEKVNDIYKYYIHYGWNKYEITNEQKNVYIDNVMLCIPSLEDIDINVFDPTSASCTIYIVHDFYVKIRYKENIINKIIINKEVLSNGQIDRIVLLNEKGKSSSIYTYIDGYLIKQEKNDEDIFIELENSLGRNNDFEYFSVYYLPTKELVYESHFKFFQTDDYKYKNFIIYPKIFNINKDITYFIDNNFTIDLLVNDKWYKYEFDLKIPESIIKLGKLEYNYWNNDERYLSNFTQIKNLIYDPDNEQYSLEFNSFMHENKLVNVNHVNFVDDYIKYVCDNNLKYINGKYINEDDFYYSIKFNDEIIKIHKSIYGKSFIIPTKNLSEKNQIYIYKNITGDYVYLLKSEQHIDDDFYIIGYINSDNNGIKLQDDGPENIEFVYNKENNTYEVETDTEIISLDIWETIHYSSDDFFNKYINQINIGNNNKYLNNIHLYDIYHNVDLYKKIPILKNNSEIYFNGLLFKHKNYEDEDTIDISGILNANRQINLNSFDKINTISNQASNSDIELYTDKNYDIFCLCNDEIVTEYKYGYFIKNVGNKTEHTTNLFSIEYNDFKSNFGKMYFKSLEELNNLTNTHVILNEESFVEEEYEKYSNNIYCNENGDLYLIKYFNKKDTTGITYENKYPIFMQISFEKKENKKWKKYEPTNIEYLNLYNKIINNTDDNLRICADLSILDGKLKMNTFEISNDEKLITLPVHKYKAKFEDKDIEILFPYTDLSVNYNKETQTYEITKEDLSKINNKWDKNSFCIHLTNTDLFTREEINNNISKKYIFNISNKESIDEMFKDKIITCVEIDNKQIIYDENNTFIISSKNKDIYLYIAIKDLSDQTEIKDLKLSLNFCEIKTVQEKYKYEPETLQDNIFEMTIGDKTYKFGNNTGKEICKLYNSFFTNYLTVNDETGLPVNLYLCKHQLSNMTLDYDFYLMHDNDFWYGLYISKDTINKISTPEELNINLCDKEFIIDNKYELKHIRSSNEFLINRMKYIPANGINQFNKDDLIVAYLENNERLPVNIFQSPKWKITPMSLGINKDAIIESSAEMCILSLPKSSNKYYKGYYDITVKYCIDKYIQHQYKNQTKLLIK